MFRQTLKPANFDHNTVANEPVLAKNVAQAANLVCIATVEWRKRFKFVDFHPALDLSWERANHTRMVSKSLGIKADSVFLENIGQ